MNERYKIIISSKKVYKEFEISENISKIRLGTTLECDFRLHRELFFEEFVLFFSKQKGKWNLTVSDNLFIDVGDIRKILSKDIRHKDSVTIRYQESDVEAFTIDFLIDFNNGLKKYERIVNLESVSSLRIGSDTNCQIYIKSPYTDDDLIELQRLQNGFSVNVIRSVYGVLLNGVKEDAPIVIKDGDFFSIADFTFFYNHRRIWTEIRSEIKINGLSFSDFPIPENYPKFQRNTRLKSVLDKEEIEILDPPAKPKKNKSNLITSLLPAFGMLVSSGFMALVGGTGMIVFSAITGGMAILTSLVGVFQNQKDYNTEIKDRIEKYKDYSKNKEMEIVSYRNDERKRLEATYIDEKTEMQRINQFSADLFDRAPADEDFLSVRLGKGNVEAVKRIKYKKQEKLEIEDNLQLIPQKLSEKYQYITFAPVVCNFAQYNAIGIIGQEEHRFDLFKNIVIDLCSRHFPTDLKLFFISDKENAHKIDWLRFLPFLQNHKTQSRNIAVDEEGKNRLFDFLYKELSQRKEEKTGENYVVFFYDECGFQNHPISKFVSEAKELKVTFVFMKETKAEVPLGCESMIYVDSFQKGRLVFSENQENVIEFEYESFDDSTAKKLISLIDPMYTEEISLEAALTKSLSIFEMLNILETNDLNLTERWNSSKVYQSMAAPIGVTKSGLVYLDLHDKAHGPHGLVAGTTGSGKSELLQTYILSIATLFHPHEVAFVIIDFKGGGMVNQFKKLPHLLGAITNIDGKSMERSLKSIRAELEKRQRLFSEADVNHIDKYIKKYKIGEAKEPIPHLILIVDEFAELKQDQPDFMNELISTARIGRSLGVHLILATQKPHGMVSEEIWSNSRFKLCLKVQNPDDSKEVIDSPLAAEIKEPGRAYLQVGNNEIFELFQSAYSGSPERMVNTNEKEFTIYSLDKSGRRVPIFTRKREKQSDNSTTQLDAIVNYVNTHCIENRIKKLSNICLPPLMKSISFPISPTMFNCCFDIGIYDDPDNQIQTSTYVDFDNKNTIIIGSSQYGKTNLLQSVIRNIATHYSPNEAVIYIMDFASMVLTNFDDLNHVGGVVTSTEDEKFRNLLKLLSEEIVLRKDKLISAGVGSYSSYIEAGYTDIPHIYLMIDNLTAVMELYLMDDDELLTIIREGISVGISTIVTSMQLSGIGFKYISNFANRICFYCNDSNDYYGLYPQLNLVPDEVQGRCVIELDRRIVECQTYLSFEGEREIDRIKNMQSFISEINHKNQNLRAKQIPSIPQLLTQKYLFELVENNTSDYNLAIGLTYLNISPFYLDIAHLGILGLCGKENTGHKNFIDYLIDYLESNQQLLPSKVVILDDYSRKYSHLKNSTVVTTYTLDNDIVLSTISQWHAILEQRYNNMVSDGNFGESNELLLLIIQNNDVAKLINDDWNIVEKFRDIIGRYKGMNVGIIFSNYPNASIAYDAPEPIRAIKQEKHLLFFEDLDNLKPVEVSYEDIKANKKKLETGDAYYIRDNDVIKLKLVKHN